MQIVTVLKNRRVKGRYLIDIDDDPDQYFTNEMSLVELVQSIKPGYEYVVSKLKEDDFDNGVYEMFWEDDDPKCETCKHEYEQRKEEKISIAEFNGKTYSIPEKRWPLVAKNLSYYSEHEK